MGSKTKQQTQSTNTYAYMAPPPNPYFKSAEALIGEYDGGAAGVREAHGRNKQEIKEAGNDLFGSSTPNYVRERVMQSRMFRNNADLGRGLSEAKQNEVAYKNSAYMSLGGATAPQLVQTGGTSNSVQQGPGAFSQLGSAFVGGLSSAAGGALGA